MWEQEGDAARRSRWGREASAGRSADVGWREEGCAEGGKVESSKQRAQLV